MTLFVTGGGSGIGQHLARLAVERGESVAVFDLSIPGEVADGLVESAGPDRVSLHQGVDVRDLDRMRSAVDAAVERVGRPTLAINSAGVSRNALFVESALEDYELTVGVNLIGSRNFAAAVRPHLRRGTRLALIASLAGITGGYTYAAYASSKAGVIGLARVLRLEWAPDGIGVSVICPPEIMTPMVEQYAMTMHPATRALKDVAGTLPIDEACDEIMALLGKGRFIVIPGRKARRVARMTRLLPDAVTTRMADRIVRKATSSPPSCTG